MNSAEVHILGQKYILKGDASVDRIKQLADFVDKHIKEVYARSTNITPLKATILASLNIADELHRIKNEYNSISKSIKNIEDKADAMVRLLD